MVKTRHSDELMPPEPQLMTLNLERGRRHSRVDHYDGGDDLHNASRAYTEGSNAFNIFEEKVVESRLRPRTGPSRAYNYLDVESSEEDIQNRSRRVSRRHLSPELCRGSSSRRQHQRQIKLEVLENNGYARPRGRHSHLNMQKSKDDSDDTDHDEVKESERAISRGSKRGRRSLVLSGLGSLERRSRQLRNQDVDPVHDNNDDDESDTEIQTLRRVRTTRRRLPTEDLEEDQEPEEMAPKSNNLPRRDQEKDDSEEDREEQEHVRRSSRKRRHVFDTLNQSYLVNMPGQRKEQKDGDNEDTKDEDSDNQRYSDMYSRVKRKRVQVKRNMYGVPVEESDSDDEDHDENTNNNNEDEEEDDDDDDEEEEEEEEGEENTNENRRVLRTRRSTRRPQPQRMVKSYSLRQHKPTIDRYKPPEETKRVRKIEHSVFASTPTKTGSKQPYQSPARKRKIRKRSALNSSSSSTSSSSGESSDEKNFKRRKEKSMAKSRNRMMPMNMTADALASASVLKDRVKSGVSLADVEPMTIDRSVTFDSIGGLGKHIRKLKEMVVFPLLYDNVFQRFKVDPPRGVLFYGPPGTGKTLVARALANECSQGDRRVAFFMRKGADCLSKWVGESERQLRLLFDQAYKFRPSIIFFDEIDGLAPVRSSRQDQIHSSIVSTLLALMDGLDSRGEIVVIGATNRIDSLDPALRRPGRFDREFLFPLPSLEARKQILKIHTDSWNPKLNDHFLSELAEKCVGYCGADLKALCTEAAMQALRRRYPQIYLTNEALQLDVTSINVSAKDFFNAISSIIPTSQRSVSSPARALAPRVAPLLQPQLESVVDKLGDIFPPSLADGCSLDSAATLSQAKELVQNGIPWEELMSDEDEDAPSIFVPSTQTKGSKAYRAISEAGPSTSLAVSTYLNFTSYATSRPTTFRPRLMLVGSEGQGQTTHLAPAIIHRMENLPVHVLDLPTLYAVTAKTPEESCANVFHEAKRKCPSILYLPYMDQWWDVMADTLRATLLTLIHDLDPALPLLLLATSERPYQELDPTLRSLFSTYSCEVNIMRNPNKEERHGFFKDLLLHQAFKPPPQKKQAAQRMLETLPLAAAPKPKELSAEELALLIEKEELTLMELRIFLRDVLNKLGTDKKFSIFAKPVNIEDAADYYDIIETPMDLSSMMAKIDLHEYSTVRDFLNDIDLICSNALEYNPDRGPMDRIIRHRACALKDTAYAIIKTELDKDFEKTCVEIQESRKRRGEKSGTVPNFYNTRLKHGSNSSRQQGLTSALPSYLDKPQIERSIPKPDGERFSRRVRGLNIDPVPPLEIVEKVYKSTQSGNPPTREDKSNQNNNGTSEDKTEEKKEEQEEDNVIQNISNNAAKSELASSQSSEANSTKKEEDKDNSISSATKPNISSSSKRKKNPCVWCKPKRKRPRMNLSKSEAKDVKEEEAEAMSEEDGEAEEKDRDDGSECDEPKPTDQPLVLDVLEASAKSTTGKSAEQREGTTSIRSPTFPGVSTRRSSMSPRLAGSTPSSQVSTCAPSKTSSGSKQNGTVVDDQTLKSGSSKNFDSDEMKTDKDADTCNAKALLMASLDVANNSLTDQPSSSLPIADRDPGKDKSRVVKRLDLDLVITDSGHGSSLDSNGDSRDSSDHRVGNQAREPTSKVLPNIEALVNSNQSCSSEMRSSAADILEAPTQSIVADVPRMTRLLQKLVSRTEGYTVERLEKMYSQLGQLIYRHRHNYDRAPMMLAMERKVDDLTLRTDPTGRQF